MASWKTQFGWMIVGCLVGLVGGPIAAWYLSTQAM